VAREEGVEVLEGWFPAFFLGVQISFALRRNIVKEDTEHWLECRVFDGRLSAAWLAEHFYYSLGDFDVY